MKTLNLKTVIIAVIAIAVVLVAAYFMVNAIPSTYRTA